MEPRSRSSLAGATPSRGDAAVAGGAEIIIIDARWRRLVPGAERIARRAVAAAGGAGSVVLDRDLRVKRLNARHRGRNKPTNVLTFETHVDAGSGDIVLALETVRREAQSQIRRPAHHLAHLIVHGALHLRGHDHHLAGDARRMEMQEARILHRLRVPNPWKTRPAVTASSLSAAPG